MPLKPVQNGPEPEYPDMDEFARERRRFLQKLGVVAGAVFAGQLVAGCRKEPPQSPAGTPGPPTPPAPPSPREPSARPRISAIRRYP